MAHQHSTSITTLTSIQPATSKAAYDAIAESIANLDEDQLVPMNLDVTGAIALGLGAARRLETLVLQLQEELPKFDITKLARLRTYALGAWHAHVVALEPRRAAAEERFAKLMEEARAQRLSLLLGLDALADRGLVPKEHVAQIRSGAGNLDMANDLCEIAILYTGIWPSVRNKTAVDWEDVQRAAVLGAELLDALEMRRLGMPATSDLDPRRVRERAFTLFARTYDDCRRAVTYLRWEEEDIDSFMPSLYTMRKPRRKTEAEASSTDLPQSEPEEPIAPALVVPEPIPPTG